MAAISSNTSAKENNDINSPHYIKFQKMVTISQKLYNSDLFKGKDDHAKQRKLVIQLRGLYNNTNINKTFEEAVIECGWNSFKEWLQTTKCEIKLESENDQKKLIEMLNNEKEINWSIIEGPNLDKQLLKELVHLTSTLMKTYYDNSPNMGPWSDSKMTEELIHKNSHCIIVRNKINNELIGYVSFRMELNIININEEYYEFYVYELMINNKYQRTGYGKYLMNICEFIASGSGCDYIELTVFTSNVPAMKFYRKTLGFAFDKNEHDEFKHDYRILNKNM